MDLLIQKRIEHFQSITFICYCRENDQELKYYAKNIWLCKKKNHLKKVLLFCRKQTFSMCVFFFAFSTRTLNSGIFKLYMCEEKKLYVKLIPLKEYLFKNSASTFFSF